MSESLLNKENAYENNDILGEIIVKSKLMLKFYLPIISLAFLYFLVPFVLDFMGFNLFPYQLAISFVIIISTIVVVAYIIINVLFATIQYLINKNQDMSFKYYMLAKENLLLKLLHSLIIVIVMGLIQVSALGVKGNITAINPFSWDKIFMNVDRAIHANIDPWELVVPFVGNGFFAHVIDRNYESVWFLLLIGSWMFMAMMFRFNINYIRYILAFAIAWIVGGNILAIAFSSAGPAFYGKLGYSPDVYAPLFEHLRSFGELNALNLQEGMWQNYVDGVHPLGGISAFPSMHNAIAVLLALFAWKHSRIAGILVTVHAVLVFIGSIYLGWHYAVDAYAGIAIAFFSWWLAGRLAKRLYDTPEAERLRKILYG